MPETITVGDIVFKTNQHNCNLHFVALECTFFKKEPFLIKKAEND